MDVASLQHEELPPQMLLPGTVWQDLAARLQKWNTIPLHQVAVKRLALRVILIELFTCLLQARLAEPQERQPKWLTELLVAMRNNENMTAGLAAMRSLSGKSHEHLCRALRRYTGQSPSEFICRLRLSYAANLLANSDLPVLTVMLESGFDNASHFNRCFKACYDMTPRQFRSSLQNNLF